jgi:bifunctional DNase/RNase
MTDNRVPVKVMGVYGFKDAEDVEWIYANFEDESGRQIRIFIGQCEAWAIAQGLEDIALDKAPERPFAYEAALACLTVAGAVVEESYINDVREGVFYALVRLRVSDQVHEIDMRPSDAVNFAIRTKCPLLMNEKVIQFARASQNPQS